MTLILWPGPALPATHTHTHTHTHTPCELGGTGSSVRATLEPQEAGSVSCSPAAVRAFRPLLHGLP